MPGSTRLPDVGLANVLLTAATHRAFFNAAAHVFTAACLTRDMGLVNCSSPSLLACSFLYLHTLAVAATIACGSCLCHPLSSPHSRLTIHVTPLFSTPNNVAPRTRTHIWTAPLAYATIGLLACSNILCRLLSSGFLPYLR